MALQEIGIKLVLDPGSFYSELGRAGDAVGQIGNKAKDSGGGFSALEQVGIGALRKIGEAAITAGAQLVQGIGGAIAQSVSVAGEFEGAVNNLAAVSGTALADAGFSFDDVSDKALQLGIDTAYSASQSIAAMTELVKGGVPVSQVMAEATDHTLALAAAAGIELGPAAEIVAKQFGVWGETGVTTANVVDLITQASNASTVGAEDLALGLAQAGGTAKTAGVEFDELVQSMALIAPNFSSASDAGTSFKTFLARLIPSTAPAKDAMAELGLMTTNTTKIFEYLTEKGITPLGNDLDTLGNQFTAFAAQQGWTAKETQKVWSSFDQSVFYDMEGSFVGMEEAARLLQTATADLSEEQRLSAFQTIFGADAIRAAAAVANAGAEGFNAMGDSMAAAGTASETAAIQNQGFDFAMDQLAGTLETIQIIIGTALLPILTQFIEGTILPGLAIVAQFAGALTGNQEALASLSPPLQQVATVLQILADAFMEAGPFSIEFAEALSLVHPALQPLMLGVNQVVSFLQNNWQAAVAVAGGILAAALVPALAAGAAAFGAAVVAAAPVIAIFAAVGVAAAALKGAWDSNFGGIQEKTQTAMAAVQKVITSVLGVVTEFWNRNGADIMATAQRTWSQVQEIVGTVVAIVAEIVTRVFSTIADFLNEHGATIQRVLDFAWNNIRNTIDLVMNTIQGIVTTILGIVTGDWEKASEGIQQIVDGISDYLTDTFNNIVSLITDLGPDFLSAASELGQNIIDGIVNAVSAGASAIAEAASSAAQAALDAAKSLLGISSPSKVFANEVGYPITQGVAQGILDGIPEVADAIEELAGETKDKAIKAFEGIGQAAAKMFDDALSGRLGIIRTRQQALRDWGKFEDKLVELREQRRAGVTTDEQREEMHGLLRRRAELAALRDKGEAYDEEEYNTIVARMSALQTEISGNRAKLDAEYQRLSARMQEAERMRAAAQNEASEIAKVDAVAARDYLALREDQILKILELEAERDGAETKEQQARANRILELERAAQAAELEQFKIAMEKRQKELASVGDDFEKTGVSIVDGLIKGIQEKSDALSSALSEVMANALRVAQQQLGIRSPSIVFAQQVGMPISEGVALGVQQAMPVAMGAVANMAAGLVRPAAPALARGGSVSSSTVNNFNYSPSYGSAPRQPSQDFAVMRAFATSG
jgi:phage-related protein